MLVGLLSILFIVLLWLALNLLKHLQKLSSLSHLPGPPAASWISGHVTYLMETMEKEGTAYPLRMEWAIRFPEMYLIWIYNTPQVSVTDGSLLKSYFSQPHEKFLYPFLGYCMGHRMCGLQSIFNEPGTAIWANKRRTYKRFFSNFNQRHWIEVTLQHCGRLVEILKTKDVVDMEEVTKQVTFDIVSHLAFGLDPNSVTRDSPVRHSLHTMLSIGFKRAFFVVRNNIPFVDREVKRELGRAVETSRKYSREILEERRMKGDGVGGEDLLDMIISCNAGDVEAMIDDVIVFMIAGYDTAANVLAFTIALLLEHPECTEKLVREVERVDFSSTHWQEDMSYVDARKQGDMPYLDACKQGDMPYLDACISESMRLFPPGPVSHRINTYSTTLGGYHIPAGTQLQACVFVQHRLPRYWDDPNSFLPERWLRRGASKTHVTSSQSHVTSSRTPVTSPWPAPGSYIPFMVGPRNCIGKNLAEVLLRVILCELFSKLDLERADQRTVEAGHCFTLCPKNAVLAKVSERKFS